MQAHRELRDLRALNALLQHQLALKSKQPTAEENAAALTAMPAEEKAAALAAMSAEDRSLALEAMSVGDQAASVAAMSDEDRDATMAVMLNPTTPDRSRSEQRCAELETELAALKEQLAAHGGDIQAAQQTNAGVSAEIQPEESSAEAAAILGQMQIDLAEKDEALQGTQAALAALQECSSSDAALLAHAESKVVELEEKLRATSEVSAESSESSESAAAQLTDLASKLTVALTENNSLDRQLSKMSLELMKVETEKVVLEERLLLESRRLAAPNTLAQLNEAGVTQGDIGKAERKLVEQEGKLGAAEAARIEERVVCKVALQSVQLELESLQANIAAPALVGEVESQNDLQGRWRALELELAEALETAGVCKEQLQDARIQISQSEAAWDKELETVYSQLVGELLLSLLVFTTGSVAILQHVVLGLD